MNWCTYVITSDARIQDGSFARLLKSLKLPNEAVFLGLRGVRDNSFAQEGMHVLALPHAISLSDARNALLEKYPPRPGSVVAFSDDDCWFGLHTKAKVEEILAHHDFALGVVDTWGTEDSEVSAKENVDLECALKRSASAAIFVNSDKLGNFRFDPKLGLGAKFRSAEDLDLVLYLLEREASGLFDSGIRVGHPSKNRQMEYFPGSIAALAKYTNRLKRVPYLIGRRLAHGVVFLLTRKLDLPSLILAIRSIFDMATRK